MGRMPATGKTEEAVEDIAGRLAQSGYGLAYDDSQGLIKKTRTGPNPYDVARSFGETDVTLSHTKTRVSGGSIEFQTRSSSTTTRSADNNSRSENDGYGLRINPNSDLAAIEVTLSGNQGSVSEVALTDGSDNLIASKTSGPYSAGSVVRFEQSLTAGNSYDVVVYDGGNSYTLGKYDSTNQYPYSSTHLDITTGVGYAHPNDANTPNTYNDYAYAIDSVKAEPAPYTNGQATIEWPSPTDIYEWDTATFTRTPDGETVNVYVAYSTDGGSTWSRTNSGNPVSRNYDLAADSNISPSDRVRLEVELSRASGTNNPTLDSAIRSWAI